MTEEAIIGNIKSTFQLDLEHRHASGNGLEMAGGVFPVHGPSSIDANRNLSLTKKELRLLCPEPDHKSHGTGRKMGRINRVDDSGFA
jgi:hypothetical protein